MIKGVKVTTTLSRTLYLELDENATAEDAYKKFQSEVIMPKDAMDAAQKAFAQLHLNIPRLDLKDWEVTDVNFEPIEGNETDESTNA